ncbi:hypothetical protein [Candidatus Palauibacter sp.]|uniref:hypothetical protein n=1 Tax=Candidatus Palauibacter sp. TaxID=3101350 RepID=UPI003B52077C
MGVVAGIDVAFPVAAAVELRVGGGVELAVLDGLSLGLDLVYSIGLSRIDDDPDAPKNQGLTVQAGVVIPVGG